MCHDKIDTSGKVTLRISSHLYKIADGRTHARTPVLLRELTINPEHTYQRLSN